MSPEHEAHLERIKAELTKRVDVKYRAGQKEHKGELWLKEGLIDEALNEVVDLAVYLLTLKDQIKELKEKANVEKITTEYENTWTALKDK